MTVFYLLVQFVFVGIAGTIAPLILLHLKLVIELIHALDLGRVIVSLSLHKTRLVVLCHLDLVLQLILVLLLDPRVVVVGQLSPLVLNLHVCLNLMRLVILFL